MQRRTRRLTQSLLGADGEAEGVKDHHGSNKRMIIRKPIVVGLGASHCEVSIICHVPGGNNYNSIPVIAFVPSAKIDLLAGCRSDPPARYAGFLMT